ncbi:Nif3-like dinuclear metal center hexameric protein [Mycetocola spongiae]|uniref:Nif3-like dinuclear metal center hexameric protein n=1 Tax=Mycetocola spongiae TaxID=2859226 RepID=UPI001CF459BE|nr:Nif3-like dinuclear metal center hexameric protein [Mycetocola spongiae]UCR89489.1 Nif3-like dinuclear metal center hexameric protein [Mycetocola spongiae]
MKPTLRDLCEAIENPWPASGAESWDASGPVSGDFDAPIERVLLAVDPVAETVAEAVESGADVLLTHHPLLLRGVTSVAEDRYKGSLIARLIRADCALIAAHTNADVVEDGTSAVLAHALGLRQITPLTAGETPTRGIGRVGTLAEPRTLGQIARELAVILPATASGVRGSGDYDRPISRVALCAGAGDSLLSHPEVASADLYITSDLRHHPASEFREQALLGSGPALLDVSHWASEWLWLDTAAENLRRALPGVSFSVSDLRTDPWDFVVTQ